MLLNPEQTQAVEHINGPCVVTAIPGSGKTRALTARVVNLIKHNIKPDNILCLTFTNKAANEMKERIHSELGDMSKLVWISTFHALCVAILRRFGKSIGVQPNFSIYDSNDQQDLMEKIVRMDEYEDYERMAKIAVDFVNDLREDIKPIEEYDEIESEIKDFAKKYIDTLQEFNAIDFSGLQSKTYELLTSDESVKKTVTNKFKYIMVDEGQDTNIIQYELIKLLAEKHHNLFIVGDIAQSIYAFRGAKPENMAKVLSDFDGAIEITLPRNYRSNAEILKYAQRLIRRNDHAKNVTLISEKGNGGSFYIKPYFAPQDEAENIARQILNLHDTDYKWSDFAVLYRTNMQSKTPETVFKRMGIPYRLVGGFSFFDRKEIKTGLAYLSLFSNPSDTISFNKAISYPARSIGATTVGKLEQVCKKEGISILQACEDNHLINGVSTKARNELIRFANIYKKYSKQSMSIAEIASGLFSETGFYDQLIEESQKDDNSQKRVANIDELLVDMTAYGEQNTSSSLSDYLQSIQIMSSDDSDDDNDRVTLMTMHASKGLEFKCVYVIGCEVGLIPHRNCLNNIEEERRLLFVAITRGKSRVQLSYCGSRMEFNNRRASASYKSPSPFLYEMDEEHYFLSPK